MICLYVLVTELRTGMIMFSPVEVIQAMLMICVLYLWDAVKKCADHITYSHRTIDESFLFRYILDGTH